MRRNTIFSAFFLILILLTPLMFMVPVALAEDLSDFTDTNAWAMYHRYFGTSGPMGYNATHAYVQSSGYTGNSIIFWSRQAYNVSSVTLQVDAVTVNGGQYDDNRVIILLTTDNAVPSDYAEALFHDGIRLEYHAFRDSSGGVSATLIQRSSGVDTVLGDIALSSYTGKLELTVSNGQVTAKAYDGTWRTVGSASINPTINYYIVLNAFTEWTDAPTYMANFAVSGLSAGGGGGSSEPETLADWLTWYTNEVDWQADVYTAYTGLMFNVTSISDVVAKVNALSSARDVLFWAAVLKKYNVESQLENKIKWALDNMPMLANGLPNTYDNSFLVYDRGTLYAGFYYSQKWNYATSRWNLNTAYNSFKSAVTNAGHPVLHVYGDGSTYTISYGPRYYDEAAQTLDVYLIFYDLGVQGALTDALNVWNWINANLWTGTYYKYAVNWDTYECAAGGFLHIALKLWARYPNLQYTSRLLTDINTRFLSNRWSSPQWTNYAVAHAAGYSETRLQETIMAWSSMLGVYNEMDSTARANLQALIGGYTNNPQPAWYYLTYNSGLYDAEDCAWKWNSMGGTSASASSAAAALKLLLGIKPGTATLAIPLEEYQYEYTLNMFDKDLFMVDTAARKVKLAIFEAGSVTFMYNASVSYSFSSSGVYVVQFSSDWNNIVSVTKQSSLPTNRVYLGTVISGEPTPTPDEPTPRSAPSLPGLVAILGLLIAFLGVTTAVRKKLP